MKPVFVTPIEHIAEVHKIDYWQLKLSDTKCSLIVNRYSVCLDYYSFGHLLWTLILPWCPVNVIFYVAALCLMYPLRLRIN